ncbi:MAG TPA: hypothetical protein VKH37_10735, partial [Ferruginibacter sp.]|nr:hypothetical protein [Ferruginibacter sp.]
VDDKGILQWFYTYGIVPFVDRGYPAYKNSSVGTDLVEVEGGYILCGILQNSWLSGDLADHGFLLNVDHDGILRWINQYQDAGFLTEKFMALKLKDDRTMYVVGERAASNAGIFCGSYPNCSACLNGSHYADKEHYNTIKYLPFVKRIDPSTGTEVWDLPLETDPTLDYRVRSIAVDADDNLLVPVASSCHVNFANGECKSTVVNKIVDYSISAGITQTIEFGSMRAFDMSTGIGVSATTDGGFVVVGTKKPYNLDLNKDYSSSPYGSGYNMSGFAYTYSQTDAYVAKCNSSGNIEWTSIFDNTAPSPGGSIYTNSGNPRIQTNLDSWMNHTADRSKADIKRQECLYSVGLSTDGEIIIGGNMSSNLDDSYLAMMDNTCDLVLNNNLIQAIPSVENPMVAITNMDQFIASNISTGREPGNVHDVAQFDVNNGAVVDIVGGQDVTMYEGSDLETGTDVEVSINPSHSCTSGPIYSYSRAPIDVHHDESKGVIVQKTAPAANAARKIMVMPNPTTGLVTVRHPKEIKSIEVFDLYGKSIMKIVNHGAILTKIDLSNIASGI